MQTPEHVLTATQDFPQTIMEEQTCSPVKNSIFDEQVWFFSEEKLIFVLDLPGYNNKNTYIAIENIIPKVLIVQPRGAPERRFEIPKNNGIIYDSVFAIMEDGILTVSFDLESKIKHIQIN